MSTPNSENQKLTKEETSTSSMLPKTSLKYDFRDVKFGVGDYAIIINNYADASLNETVAKIEALINNLSQNSPVNSTTQQMAIAIQVIANIEDNPNWKQKAIKAHQQGLLESIKTNPVGVFVVSAIASWQK